mmetsp:Transcript_60891/g.145124  ORF Transcript_60891/g.145124 Transcript_60891/m.145124 type:complete len:235 (-) Transcript_60891:36-740(-)
MSTVGEDLEIGWEKRQSRSQPGLFYYVHAESGKTSLEPPLKKRRAATEGKRPILVASDLLNPKKDGPGGNHTTAGSGSAPQSAGADDLFAGLPEASMSTCEVEKKIHEVSKPVTSVACLHLLKKHVGSRRPSSWREKVITRSLEEATYQVKELRREICAAAGPDSNAKKLREEFEKLARKESDCSSAHDGGSLGKFPRGKMQPAFEKVAFSLGVNELSSLVTTDSGVHIILRVE